MHRDHSQDGLRAHRIALTTHCLDDRRDARCSCRLLEDHLGYLEQALGADAQPDDVGQAQEMLLELALIIRSGTMAISAAGYRRILDRLGRIYARGMGLEGGSAFVLTASDYADVVEAIGNRFDDYDYSRIVGQLLFYMGQLYRSRKGGWVTVYEHLAAMPTRIEGVATLKQNGFAEIHRWAEEGVANLFHIQRDIEARQLELHDRAAHIQRRIDQLRHQCTDGRDPAVPLPERRVVSLSDYRLIDRIRRLQRELELILRELDGKRQTARLIESNIREFEQKLQSARRTYLVRAVS